MPAPLFDLAHKADIYIRTHPDSLALSDLYEHYMRGLSERLLDIKHHFNNTLVITDGPRLIALDSLIKTEKINPEQITQAFFDKTEMLDIPPGTFDLVVVMGVLHTANDIQKMILQLRFALAPEGCMMAVFPGEDTLHELRDALARAEIALYGGLSPRVHPMIDARAFAGLMQQAQFQSPVVDCERTVLDYQNFTRLLHDLRATGQKNILTARTRTFAKRGLFRDAQAHYPRTPGGLYPATITLIHIMGWAPE